MVAVIVAVVVIVVLISGGGKKPAASGGEIFLQPTASTGANPFTPSVSKAAPAASATPLTSPALPSPSPTAAITATASAAAGLVSYSGSTPGLYGGTRQLGSCDTALLISYLQQNPDKARAWASVEGIAPSDIPAYVATLTPVLLRADTRVTNHGFANGQATTYQSVLQAGTAVLVDRYGVPRVRCYCGNPLTPPVAITEGPTYSGTSWPAFQPTTVVVIAPAPQPLTVIVVVDVTTGAPFARPIGGGGATDTDVPPGVLGSATPTPAATPQAAAVADLTGSWVNPQSPDSPPWVLQPSSDRTAMTGSWHGSGFHSALMGTFTTTLNAAHTAYTGTYHVIENTNVVDGTISFSIDSPTQVTVALQGNNGSQSNFTLTLPASTASPSP